MTTWLDDHSADATQRRHLLFEIDFAIPVYWTDCQIPIAYNSHMWTPKATTISGVSTQQLVSAGATLEVANADNFMSALFFWDGVADKVVKVWIACFDITSVSQVPEQAVLIFEGRIDSMAITNDQQGTTAIITLGPPADQTTMLLPNRKLSSLLRTPA